MIKEVQTRKVRILGGNVRINIVGAADTLIYVTIRIIMYIRERTLIHANCFVLKGLLDRLP